MMFWELGNYINTTVLADSMADYGKKILSTLSTKLVSRYGKSFVEANLYRMKRFVTIFPNLTTIAEYIPFLSWSHFCEIMRIKDENARLYYAPVPIPPSTIFYHLAPRAIEMLRGTPF